MNTTHLEDRDLDALLRTADPVDGERLARATRAPAAVLLRDAITDDAITDDAIIDDAATDGAITDGAKTSGSVIALRPRRNRRLVLLAAAAVAAVAVGTGVAVVGPASHDTSAYAASAVRFAQQSPRLLVTAPGWRVSDVQEDGKYGGEQHFTCGDYELDLLWVPGATSKDSDRADLTPSGYAQIDGHRAWVGYNPMSTATLPPGVKMIGGGGRQTGFDFEAVWADGPQAREVRGVFDSREQFLQVAQSLRRVDVDTWLEAMPSIVVKPEARRAAVNQMLADIPQPSGFDPTPLYRDHNLKDRYQVGADTSGAVTCAWIHQWVRGDAAAKRQAGRAMATWPRWKILQEMDRDGAWSQGISEIAAYMNGQDGMVRRSGMTLQQWAGGGIGCHS